MVVNPVLRVRDRAFGPQARLVMAIVNRTPDSFYDGGATYALEAACARVDEVVAQGADIVDIGGVKAGVGPEVTAGQEIERVVDVVTYARRAHPEVLVSVDTWRAQVADAVCAAGADIINDPWGGPDPLLPEVAARHGATLVVAHAGGMAPREDPHGVAFDDVVADVLAVTDGLAARAEAAGVPQSRIVIDPAHDFGKTTAHSLEITRRIAELVVTDPDVADLGEGGDRDLLVRPADGTGEDHHPCGLDEVGEPGGVGHELLMHGHEKIVTGKALLHQPLLRRDVHRVGVLDQKRRDRAAVAERLGIAGQHGFHAQSLQGVLHRADIGPARIHQRHPHQSAPLVLGRSAPSRRIDWRKARANALKQASTL